MLQPQAFFERLVDDAQRFDARVILVARFQDAPGGVGGRGQAEHVVHRGGVLRAFVAVAPVFGRDLPLLVGVGLAVVEASQLFVGIDRHPEFQQDRAPCLQLVLEFVDFVVGARLLSDTNNSRLIVTSERIPFSPLSTRILPP